MFTYEDFIIQLNNKIKNDEEFYYELLKTVISNPNRYTGIFRISNVKTKLIQNVTQSREIKFGDFMEYIVTQYIAAMGYVNLDKNIGQDKFGDYLSADQVFRNNEIVFLIEQKIRDDHDSTKKRGQYQNFQKKYSLLSRRYPNNRIIACMWFIDPSLVKNRNYYLTEASNEHLSNVNLYIYYGGELFSNLFQREDIWNEICEHLVRNKLERSDDILSIPDFDTSDEFFDALKRLFIVERNLSKKLISDKPEYIQLRNELFPTGYNFKRLGLMR